MTVVRKEGEDTMTTVEAPQATSFPEPWDAPVADGHTYTHDQMHNPYPKSPLSMSLSRGSIAIGFTTAMREYRTPIRSFIVTTRNMYQYDRFDMVQPANEDEARRMGEASEAAIKPAMGGLLARWNEEFLPSLLTLLGRMRDLDVETVPPAGVVTALDEGVAILREIWTIHFRIAIPMLMCLQIYDEFYADVFEGDEQDGHALLTGVASKSIEAGLGLYDLAVRAKELGLEPPFRETPADQLRAELEATQSGRTLLAELGGYLDVFGLRQDLFDATTPTWQEDPTFALASIRSAILTGRDARTEYAAMQRSAEAAAATARAQLASYPEAVRGQFEVLLQMARAASFLQEEHNFYIDQQGSALARLFFLRIGRWLVAEDVLDDPEDIAMLEFDEIRTLFANLSKSEERDRIRALVTTRRELFEQAHRLTPPPFIGPPPIGPPPADNPMGRAMGRFWGWLPPQPMDANELRGNAGSRGVATGNAFVARTLEEATGLQPGDILVTVTTMPAWTPLFGVAAAVVTETGGPLSHCAIVAREYGVPAVVGAQGATRVIQSGQRITVDGGRGIVTIEA
jgi:pyruvate,water dikinase